MIDATVLNDAITAHSRWKSRLRSAIATGQSELSPDRARSDGDCDFGRWLHAMPLQDRIRPRWRKLHDLHAKFHEEAAHILELAILRRTDEAEAGLRPGSPFSHVSAELVLTLNAWKEEQATPEVPTTGLAGPAIPQPEPSRRTEPR